MRKPRARLENFIRSFCLRITSGPWVITYSVITYLCVEKTDCRYEYTHNLLSEYAHIHTCTVLTLHKPSIFNL